MSARAQGKDKGCPVSPPCHEQAVQGGNEASRVLVLSLRDWMEGDLPQPLQDAPTLVPSVPSAP